MANLPNPRKTAHLYHSYLVRLWQDENRGTWRALVQSVQSGETIHFADLDGLYAFLRAQTSDQAQPNADDREKHQRC